MAKFSLATYVLRVKRLSDSKYVDVSAFDGSTDVLDILKKYLKDNNISVSHDKLQKKLLQVANLHADKRSLHGVIETGEYGYETRLYNVNSSSDTYKRKTTDAELMPFYYLMRLPKKADQGFIILQRFKQFGIRQMLLESFRKYFDARYSGFVVEINPFIPEEVVKQYLRNNGVKKLRFIRYTTPKDITDAYDHGRDRVEGTTELSVSVGRNGVLPVVGRIQEFLSGKRKVTSFIELNGLGFDYDTVKIELDIDKNHKTIDLSNLHKIRSYHDVTDKVKVGTNGHPTIDSINSIAKELMNDLCKSVGLGDEDA